MNQELRLGIEIARSELLNYKENAGKLTEQLHVNHENHRKKVNVILLEYKNQCQAELKRKQEEVNKLHEVVAHWMHQFMELQESTGIPSSRGSTHRRTLSRQYVEMIKNLCDKTKSATQGKIQPILKGIFRAHGDQSPPVYDE
jgi:hypothetical protein